MDYRSIRISFEYTNNNLQASQKDGKSLTVMSEAGPITSREQVNNKSFAKPVVGVKDVSQPGENPLLSPPLSDVGSKTSQIKARKGVGNETETIEKEGIGVDGKVATDIHKLDRVSLPKDATNGAKSSAVTPGLRTLATETLPNKIKNGTSNLKTPEKNETDNQSDRVTHLPVMLVPGRGNKTAHIPKPTLTSGEGNDDGEGMPSSATQTEFGMPKKIDYVIPVVITIMATPILGIAAYILYTRGRDCWDKRHYRRMDFLIDGMYND